MLNDPIQFESSATQADASQLTEPSEQGAATGGAVDLAIETPIKVAAGTQPLTVGIPFPKGQLPEAFPAVLRGQSGAATPVETTPLAHWGDGSVKWLLAEWLSAALPEGRSDWRLEVGPDAEKPGQGVQIRQGSEVLHVDTGAATFEIDRKVFRPFRRALIAGCELCSAPAGQTVLTDRRGRTRLPRIDTIEVEHQGPVRTTLRLDGRFPGCRGLRFRARLCFYAGTGLVRVRFALHNPRRAQHPGGLWDLGDRGSFFFQDLSLEMAFAGAVEAHWSPEPDQPLAALPGGALELYQDSSGGENYASPNHVNRHGRVPRRFRGYRVQVGEETTTGLRANPTAVLATPSGRLAVTVPEFWQQFPKSLEIDGRRLRIRLFPAQWDDLFELQGGERKTHTLWFDFTTNDDPKDGRLRWVHQPARALASPAWYAASGAVAHLVPASSEEDGRFQEYLAAALEGEQGLLAGREVIDEYGWRNYGDVWANHEEAYYSGPKPIISHYNNQFDVIYGALLQMLRTGDRRWAQLFDPLARHVMDIDTYHTMRDRAAYNGGLFWHTDHYRSAETATHRTFSRANRPGDGRPYGGGPSAENNYTTGFLHYFYLTGNPDAREAVLGLADWVVRMDDGSENLLGLVDDGPTGLATAFGDPLYHGPGRGSANSLYVLLDGWLVSGRRRYLAKAEQIVRRCVHPDDDIDALKLLDAERRWPYTMFLGALARYLELKAEYDTLDVMYAYGRASLLHYGRWMLGHERFYLDHPEQLEYPTEAWAAQEFRKANAFRLAARYADTPLSAALRQAGRQWADRAWNDLLAFPTCRNARAVAVLMTEGVRDAYFRVADEPPGPPLSEKHDFGLPQQFIPQKERLRTQLKTVPGLARTVGRLARPTAWQRGWRLFARRVGIAGLAGPDAASSQSLGYN